MSSTIIAKLRENNIFVDNNPQGPALRHSHISKLGCMCRNVLTPCVCVDSLWRWIDGLATGWIWRFSVGKRGAFLQRRLIEAGQSGVRVRKLGGNRAGEMRITRFLRNERVSIQEIIETACAGTFGRVSGRHILAIQGTTSLRDDGHGHSIIAHPTIAVDASNGALLGLVHAELIVRKGDLKATRKSRPFAERQSHRWLVGARHAASLNDAGAVAVTVVMDREGDIFDVFAAKPQGAELLVRANHTHF